MPVLTSPRSQNNNRTRLVVQVTRGGGASSSNHKNAPLRSTTPFVSEEAFRPTNKQLVDQSIARMMQHLHGSGSASGVCTEKSTNKNALTSILSTSDHSKSRRKRMSSNKKQSSERRIRFSKYDAVYDIKHIHDFTDQEIQDCYMHPNELKAIRRECCVAVKEYDGKKDGKEQEREGYYLRGLDQHTNKYKERKDEIGKQVYDAVFRIQDFAWESGVDCDEMIAKASMKYSEPSVIAAQMAAMSDLFSSFKGTWTQRHIPTIESKPTNCKITMA